MIRFESRTSLKRIERCRSGENLLKKICVPSQVDFIEKSALAANPLESVEICESNVQFMTSEHPFVDGRVVITIGILWNFGIPRNGARRTMMSDKRSKSKSLLKSSYQPLFGESMDFTSSI
jgi:hypothetical protein